MPAPLHPVPCGARWVFLAAAHSQRHESDPNQAPVILVAQHKWHSVTKVLLPPPSRPQGVCMTGRGSVCSSGVCKNLVGGQAVGLTGQHSDHRVNPSSQPWLDPLFSGSPASRRVLVGPRHCTPPRPPSLAAPLSPKGSWPGFRWS